MQTNQRMTKIIEDKIKLVKCNIFYLERNGEIYHKTISHDLQNLYNTLTKLAEWRNRFDEN